MCGVEVWDYPPKALYEMINAKFEHDWSQTSTLLAMVHNRTIFGKGKTKSASDFMPGQSGKGNKGRVKLTPENIVEMLM
ncbi:MAG: hypothetical protein FWD31_13670 [Planctomycetaceae bacterium]|nr:hypothetical protein [Planctomycetaceae bacterium]